MSFSLLFVVGFIVLAGFVPPPSPNDSAEAIARMYEDNLTGIRAGMILSMVSMALLAPWGLTIAAELRKAEGGAPLLVYTQVACIAMGSLIGVLSIVLFGAAAFRPGEVDPEITRTLNDLGWFLFLFDWTPYAVWCVAVALAIFLDRADTPAFPRWAAYLSLWTALLFVPAGLMVFFKSGPFAFSGLMALYVPLVVFGMWLVSMTVLVVKAANRELAAAEPLTTPPLRSAGSTTPVRTPRPASGPVRHRAPDSQV